MDNLAPVVIFTYRRLDLLEQTIDSLRKCHLSKETDIYIFADGAKGAADFRDVSAVHNYVRDLIGFKSVNVAIEKTNRGLANSVIIGVSAVIKESKKAIVLEDDLIVAPNFLLFMNSALNQYEHVKEVSSISGYTIPMTRPANYEYDVYFSPRPSSWGWGTWVDRWAEVDWDVLDFDQFSQDRDMIAAFNLGGSDLFDMLKKQMSGKINSWAIRWCYHQFKTKGLSVYPLLSKVNNIGFNALATHSNVYNRYTTPLDLGDKSRFLFAIGSEVSLQDDLIQDFRSFFSLKTRLYNRLKTYLFRAGLLVNKRY